MERPKKAYVLDASAVFADINPFLLDGDVFVPEGVLAEVKDPSSRFRLESWISARQVFVLRPSKRAVARAREEAKVTGDLPYMSKADFEVLGLALELSERYEVTVLTDDRCVQNVASRLGLKFKGSKRPEIEKTVLWLRYCPACGKTYPPTYKGSRCEVCGTELRRKPRG